MDKRILMALSAIGNQQAAATEGTSSAIRQLLDYVATYPNDGIIYRTSDMILCAHSDAAYLNESKSRSQYGVFIFLSEDDTIPRLNGPVITLAQIINFSCLQPPRPNWQDSSSRPRACYHSAKRLLIWHGPNTNLLFKLTTPPLSVSPTARSSPIMSIPRKCAYGCCDAMSNRVNSYSTGCQGPATKLITPPNITPTYTMKQNVDSVLSLRLITSSGVPARVCSYLWNHVDRGTRNT